MLQVAQNVELVVLGLSDLAVHLDTVVADGCGGGGGESAGGTVGVIELVPPDAVLRCHGGVSEVEAVELARYLEEGP